MTASIQRKELPGAHCEPCRGAGVGKGLRDALRVRVADSEYTRQILAWTLLDVSAADPSWCTPWIGQLAQNGDLVAVVDARVGVIALRYPVDLERFASNLDIAEPQLSVLKEEVLRLVMTQRFDGVDDLTDLSVDEAKQCASRGLEVFDIRAGDLTSSVFNDVFPATDW